MFTVCDGFHQERNFPWTNKVMSIQLSPFSYLRSCDLCTLLTPFQEYFSQATDISVLKYFHKYLFKSGNIRFQPILSPKKFAQTYLGMVRKDLQNPQCSLQIGTGVVGL